jgi:hypothetical protein
MSGHQCYLIANARIKATGKNLPDGLIYLSYGFAELYEYFLEGAFFHGKQCFLQVGSLSPKIRTPEALDYVSKQQTDFGCLIDHHAFVDHLVALHSQQQREAPVSVPLKLEEIAHLHVRKRFRDCVTIEVLRQKLVEDRAHVPES